MTSSNESRKPLLTSDDIAVFAKKYFLSSNPEIIDFHVQPYSENVLGYLGLHELLTIEARDADEKKTLTFFVKTLAPADNEYHRLVQREELAFYSDAVPRLLNLCKSEDPWAPKCCLAKTGVLVLEDLKSAGFKVIREPLEENQLKALTASVARFHASSILLERNMQKPLNKVFEGFFEKKVFVNDGDLKWKWLLTGIEVAEAVAKNLNLDPKHILKAYEITIEKIRSVEGQINVLGHSDLWCNNMMFSSDGTKCRLVDFQMVSYVHYAIDLVQLIYLNTTKESRIKMEKQILEYYCTIQKECFQNNRAADDEIINLNDVFRDVEEKRICGLVTAVQYFPIALLNKDLAEEYTKDTERLEQYMYVSRKEFVLKAMTLDKHYCTMIENVVRDTVEFIPNHETR